MAESRTYSGNGHSATIADPQNITREECLALARCGAEAWNSWRRNHPVTRDIRNHKYRNASDFSNFDFQDFSINFSNFRFEDGAKFSNALFAARANFDSVQFGDSLSFEGAKFEGGAGFRSARVGQGANFSRTHFTENTDFTGSTFDMGIRFDDAQFLKSVHFYGAQFGHHANFSGAKFGSYADFDGTLFADHANFAGAQFEGRTGFAARLASPKLLNRDIEQRKKWAEHDGTIPEGFEYVSFTDAIFKESVSFSGRRFEGVALFVRAQFSVAPIFYGCKLHQGTSFLGAKFPSAQGDEYAARAYRTLKLAFAQQQDIREEQRFFKLEMEEEATAEKSAKRWLYRVYKYSSDYGFNAAWPASWFLLATLVATICYALQAGLQFDSNGVYLAPLMQFSLASAIPGLEKLAEPAALRIFGEVSKGIANYSLPTVLTLLVHKAISLLALFLIGLALRNLFKMK